MKKAVLPKESALEKEGKLSDGVEKNVGVVTKISASTKKRVGVLLAQKQAGEIFMTNLIDSLSSEEEFREFFSRLEIAEKDYLNSPWLKENGHLAIFKAIIKRFALWDNFLKFMGREKINSKDEISKLKNRNDFLEFFKRKKISKEIWMSRELFKEKYSGLQKAIYNRFHSWEKFLDFMGCEVEIRTRKEREDEYNLKTKTSDEFLEVFKNLKIPGEKWMTPKWLKGNGFSVLYRKILERFITWNDFLKFMGHERKTLIEKVTEAKSPEDFNEIFNDNNIPVAKRANSGYLCDHGHSYLVDLIKERFGKWVNFLEFMGWEGFNSYKKILFFITREEFIEYFKEKKIPNKKWMSSSWLNRNKFSGLYDRIVKRFGTWERFLKFMDEEEIETEDEFDKISGLGIEESIALLQDDPLKLKRYLQFAHPELTEEEIDRLVQRSFKGLRSGKVEKNEDKYLLWEIDLDDVTFDEEIPRETKENTLTISGKSGEGSHMFVAGAYTRRKKVESDGSWSITIPLKVGEINEIRIMSLDRENELRSKQLCFDIAQEGEQDDILSLVQLLSELGAEVHRGIQENPGRFKYLCQTMEQSLIKKFGRSFADGEKYVQGIIEKEGISPSMRRVLKTVLKKFQSIHDAELPGVIEGSLLFFQKYCAYDIRRRMEEGLPGVILANDPGLGKTRTVQAATADRHTTVITPNSVVSSWEEESGRVMENTDGVLALHGLDHTIRKEMLRTRRSLRETLEEGEVHHTYLNREFLRKTTDTERFSLLSDSQTVVVHDEAHSRTIESSEQSKGAKMLEADFQLLVTATPFKNPVQFRRMMAVLKPDDVRFKSDKAFLKAFPAKDPDALKTLSLLKEEVTLRFRKEDVMETVDPGQSLDQQRHKLPMKTYIAPEERGAFTMSMDQAWSAYEMFVKWPTWCKKNNKYIPKDALATEDGLRTSNGFAKKHALRQTVNNPQYINSEAKDAKLEEMKKIVQSCLAEGRKIVIFCAYEAQVEKYAKEFAKLNPAIYSGATSKNGIRKDASGRNSKFKKGDAGDQSHGWILDGKGYPIPSVDGDCMSELDYERITFQNAPERQLMIATYDAGSVGTTFTAGKAMIFDDIPRDCVEEIQAEDRIHRIDPNRLTHSDVKYFHMKSAYPEEFLEATKKRWVVRDGSGYKEFFSVASAQKFAQANAKDEKEEEVHNAYTLFFAQGTYDEVQSANLVTQRIMFRLINDGIGDESLLKTNQMHFEGINGNGVKTLAV